MIGSLEWPTRDLLSHRASTTPERTALIDAGTESRWTYGELDDRVDRLVRKLEDAVGDPIGRIGVLLDTRPAFVTLVFAAMRTGSTLVPLNVRETPAELADKVDRTDPAVVICGRDTEPLALEVADRSGAGNDAIPVLSVDDPTRERTGRLESREGDDSSAGERPRTDPTDRSSIDRAPLEPDDTCLILFTSGTTGEPKAVRLTVGNLVASATASAFRLGVSRDDRWLCCLPMYHMGGLAPVVRSTLYGSTAVLQRGFDRHETQRVLEAYDCTGVSLVPTMCNRLLESGWEPADTLRFVLLGGAPATGELLERCRAAGVPVHPTYGTTETASQIATATPGETAIHEGTVGQPLVCTDVTVVGEDGHPLPAGEPGELVVSGPTVTPGYLDPAATDAAVGEYGLHTGDVGYRDDDGRLWVCNRRSDRIVTGGENVDPGAVLAVLRSHPAVADGAVVGLEDSEWGERVAALVVPADVDGIDLESVLSHCENRLAGFKRPKTIGVADALPRTASGTVDREAVRTRLLEDGTDVADDA